MRIDNKVQTKEPEYSTKAQNFINSQEVKFQKQIKDAVEKIPLGDIRPYKEFYRLRIRGYRVIFDWVGNEQILVLLVDNRGQSYKRGV
jgi:mRNA-degrading endonuclease RelE of RelBE toxin-antitoxin system